MTVEGRLHAAGGRAFVLALPLPTSLPIPLGVTAPAGIALATWAFAGLDPKDAAGPRALLLLAAADAETEAFLRAGRGSLTLATHYRDLTIVLRGCAAREDLVPGDRALLARAVLSASGAVLDRLDALPELAADTETAPPAADAPEIAFPRAGEAVLQGTRVPDRLLLRSGSARWLARVAAARIALAPAPRIALTLDEGGRAPEAPPAAALALSAHGFVPLRVRAA